jgi:hypothetical protein
MRIIILINIIKIIITGHVAKAMWIQNTVKFLVLLLHNINIWIQH